MAHVIFYEKPGCTGNARQQALLRAAGHSLEARNLLAANWTSERLRAFFGQLPIAEWFNPRAPDIRDGHLDPNTFNETAALQAMIASPILIRRPLLQVGDDCRAGFDPAAIDAWIGLSAAGAATSRADAERCEKEQRGQQAPHCPPLY